MGVLKGRKGGRDFSKLLNLKLDGVNIQEVSTVKYFGWLTQTWLGKKHVYELCLKLSKTVVIFSKLRYHVNVDVPILLCFSLIYPFVTYGIQVWGLTYPTYLKPVTTLQKRFVRIITFSGPRSHSEPLLKSLRLPNPWYNSSWDSLFCLSAVP